MTDTPNTPGQPGQAEPVPFWKNPAVITGAAIVVVAVILGFLFWGGDDDEETSETTLAAAEETTTTEAEEETTTTEAGEETTTTEAAEETTTTVTDECAVESLPLFEAGVLTIGTGEPVFPPWMLDDDPTSGEGFESAVAYALAEEMGFSADQVTWVRTGFDEVIAPGPKDFDFNMQQYSITEDRLEVVDFSEPYYVTNQALVAKNDNDITGATSVEELKAFRLGAAVGTTSFDFIETVIEPDTPAAVYDDNAAAVAALDAGQLDGLLVDLPTGFYVTAVQIEDGTIVGVFEVEEDLADQLGLLMPKDSGLKPCVDAAMLRLRDAGTLDALADEWLVTGEDLPVFTP